MMLYALFFTFLAIFVATALVTLLGITKRIDVEEKFLRPLFTTLILEVVGAVISLFLAANFFGTSALEFMESLPIELRATNVADAGARIRSFVMDCQEDSRTVVRLEGSLNEMNTRIRDLEEYDELRGNVLILFAKLNLDIARSSGGFINLAWHPEEKTDIAHRIREALAAIGGLHSDGGNDPLEVRQALIEYQTRRGLSRSEGNFGRETLNSMISDHLERMRRDV